MPPIDPGGFAVDRLRSTYSTVVDFGDGVPITVHWYFVPRGTPSLPFTTAFASRNWSRFKPWIDPVGETFDSPRPWRNGSRTRAYPLGRPIGTPEQWLRGIKPGTPYVPLIAPGTPAGTVPNVAGVVAADFAGFLSASARTRSWSIVGGSFRGNLSATAFTEAFGSSRASALMLTYADAATRAVGVSQAPFMGLLYADSTTQAEASTEGECEATLSARASTVAAAHATPAFRGTLSHSAATTSKGVAAVKGTGTLSFTAATASFSVVTPTGSCGSLPSSLVIRYSGGSGQYNSRFAGKSATLTYSSLSQTWSGTLTDNLGSLCSVTMGCAGGTWRLNMTEAPGCSATGIVMSGTSGATPNLTGTVTGACTGSVTATITRT